ncbi:hypothetical protein KJ654_01085, partial [Patescibacteria group bacterium]|nr:hypothetical protein [Patescibacteria group bacterium]
MINVNTDQSPQQKRKKYRQAFIGSSTLATKPPLIKPTETEIDEITVKLHQKVGNKPEAKSTAKQTKQNKIFGLETRSVAAVVSIALFFVISMAGVLIALKQRLQPEQVAVPTAPKSRPAA